jgi:3-oxoadipate enol-lactonase
LYYEDEGTGTPVVLLHGLGGSAQVWDEHTPELSRHHRVLRPDLRGFGRSDRPPGPYTVRDYVEDVLAVLVAAGVTRAHVLGISLGGVIAQRFALDHPQWVRSLVLVSTSSEISEKATQAWRRLADLVESVGFEGRIVDPRRSVAPAFAERYPERLQMLAEQTRQCDPRAYAAAARAVAAYHYTEELRQLRHPVLILQGKEDQLTPPGGSVKMARAIPHSRLLFVPEAGHNLPMEQPEAFLFAVLGFWAGIDLGGSEEQVAAQGAKERRQP